MGEAASALIGLGQQVLQQQGGQDQPTVCFALVPLMIPVALIVARRLARQVRRLSTGPA